MRVKIYQVNSDRDTNGVKFRGLDQEAVSQGEVQIDSSVYDEVFNAEMDFDGLQDLFIIFNTTGHPLHRGHSMSVSDVVVTDKGAFFCNDIGFAQVDFDESQTQKPDDLMRVVYVEPGKPAYEAEIRNDLYAEQKAVGGLIEPVYLEEDICIVGNEESKLIGLPGNRRLENGTIMAGSFFVVGDNGSEFRSLTDEETQRMLEMFSQPHEISQAEVEADTGFVFISM